MAGVVRSALHLVARWHENADLAISGEVTRAGHERHFLRVRDLRGADRWTRGFRRVVWEDCHKPVPDMR